MLDFDVHQGVQRLSRDLNAIYRRSSALWQLDTSPEGFSWIDANDAQGNTLSFLRMSAPVGDAARDAIRGTAGEYARGAARDIARDAAAASGGAGSDESDEDARDVVACVANFSALPHLKYRIGLPRAGRWRELLNTDAAIYGGSGVGNLGGIEAVPEPYHGRPASATITVPPLGVLWLAPEE